MINIGASVIALLLYVGMNVALAARNALTFPKYWQDKANEPVASDAIRLLALGDSAMQAIGAAHPDEGIAGRIARYLSTKAGRPVHITNLSKGGAGVEDILDLQLPQIDLDQPDLIMVATSSDLERQVPLDTYGAKLRALLLVLPRKKP